MAPKHLKVLYLTCLESIVDNGVYDSQVRKLITRISRDHETTIRLTQLAILPGILIRRKGLHLPSIKHRKSLRFLRQHYKRYSIELYIFSLPLPIIKRWHFYLNILNFALILPWCLAALLYHLRRKSYHIIHCRSYLATCIALLAKLFFPRIKVIFDVRGFYPEEGIVHGCWKKASLHYSFWKKLEARFFSSSDMVIALSDKFKHYIKTIAPTANCVLIPASVETTTFKSNANFAAELRSKTDSQDNILFIYSGGLGSWHSPILLARIFEAIKSSIPRSKLLVLTNYDKERLAQLFTKMNLHAKDYFIFKSQPSQVPLYLQMAHFGIVPLDHITKHSAKHLIADTMIGLKVAEYLAAGLPIIVNSSVGGLKSLMDHFNIGCFFSPKHLSELPYQIQNITERYTYYRQHCLYVANMYFNLNVAANKYYQIYKQLHIENCYTNEFLRSSVQ